MSYQPSFEDFLNQLTELNLEEISISATASRTALCGIASRTALRGIASRTAWSRIASRTAWSRTAARTAHPIALSVA